MKFVEIGIPIGSQLQFKSGGLVVKVVGEKKVDFEGEECSLTKVTRKALGLPNRYPLQPSPYWLFEGKSVKELYEAYHDDDGE